MSEIPPRPWRVKIRSTPYEGHRGYYLDTECGVGVGQAWTKEAAEFIVHLVNAEAQVVEALTYARELCEDNPFICGLIDAALALLRGDRTGEGGG